MKCIKRICLPQVGVSAGVRAFFKRYPPEQPRQTSVVAAVLFFCFLSYMQRLHDLCTWLQSSGLPAPVVLKLLLLLRAGAFSAASSTQTKEMNAHLRLMPMQRRIRCCTVGWNRFHIGPIAAPDAW
jgi:hypothetical protein